MKIIASLIACMFLLLVISCRKDEGVNNENVCDYGDNFNLVYSNNIDSEGLLPLNRRNYWVYADTIWTDNVVTETSVDTIKVLRVYSLSEDIWWDFNQILPAFHQSTNGIYALEAQFPTGCKAKRLDYFPTTTDTLKEWVAYEGDMLIERISYTMDSTFNTPAGNFDNCSFISTGFSQQNMILKPGIGFIEMNSSNYANGGGKRKYTLISYHLE